MELWNKFILIVVLFDFILAMVNYYYNDITKAIYWLLISILLMQVLSFNNKKL